MTSKGANSRMERLRATSRRGLTGRSCGRFGQCVATFNEWTPERAKEAAAIISYAADLGAPRVVLCPVHNEDHGWSAADAERNLRVGLANLAPILRDHGVIGYVEPLGMRGSTMKNQHMAVRAVGEVDGWDTYQLCYDTFQFFRCGDTEMHYDRIGLAHMSGISRKDLQPSELTEPDRGLVFIDDRVDNIGMLRNLVAGGYSGFISMEPFNPAVQHDPDLLSRLRASLEYVTALLPKAPDHAGPNGNDVSPGRPVSPCFGNTLQRCLQRKLSKTKIDK